MLPYSEQEKYKNNYPEPNRNTELEYFFSHAYHDMRFFLKTITKSNNSIFTFFGDMQSGLYYISDNMKDVFGFESNLVENLPLKWRSRVRGDRWKTMYDEAREEVLREKKDTVDQFYQVTDRFGKAYWVHCFGAVKWDEKKDKPLFFAGRFARQDELYAVDTASNFPTEVTLHQFLHNIQENGEERLTIGCCLNHITRINAVRGRAFGDKLIRTISQKMLDTFSGEMSFYRLSGIRCMAVVEKNVKKSEKEIIDRIREVIEQGYEEYDLEVKDPCSFAVMKYPKPGVRVEDFQEDMISLIKLAASEPQSEYVTYSEQNIRKVREFSMMQMELSQNVLDGMVNFRAVIQPVVDAETGKIVAGETLMRWKYKGEDVSPAKFIPILESDYMINVAGRWVMEKAVQACAEIVPYIPDFYLTVNVSLKQLYDEKLSTYIPELLKKYHLEGRHLVVEMTESSMDQEPTKLKRFIESCREWGVRMALDDFGTGYSSIRVLLQYNTNIIKLDRSLLLEMTKSENKSDFISSIVYACHQFGKKVCVEGVETEQQRVLVQSAKCDLIQGFYFYRPTELDEVYKIAQQQSEEETEN